MARFRHFSAAVIAIVAVASTAYGQDDDVIRVDSTIVTLNATIQDASGRHVAGLKQQQFKVFEDGIEQEISLFAAEQTPFAAVILLDTSGSMEQRVSLARAAAIKFLDGLREEDTASVYRFDSKIEMVRPFSSSRDIGDKVFELRSYGMTALNDAIYQAATDLGARHEKRRAIIVLSDGMDTYSKRSADKALKAALAINALIYTVDMSSIDTGGKERIQNQGVLKNFAEKSGGLFVATPGGVAMREAFERIVNELGAQYTVGFQPTNERKDGKWRSLELRVARPNLSIRTRKGYTPQKSK
jgi:Ca-activated chloride channel family protein